MTNPNPSPIGTTRFGLLSFGTPDGNRTHNLPLGGESYIHLTTEAFINVFSIPTTGILRASRSCLYLSYYFLPQKARDFTTCAKNEFSNRKIRFSRKNFASFELRSFLFTLELFEPTQYRLS